MGPAILTFLLLLAMSSTRAAAQIFEYKPSLSVRAARKDRVPDEVVVKFKAGTSDSRIDALHKRFGTSKKRVLSQVVPLRLHRVKVAAGSTVQEMIERYDSSSMVEYAEPNYYAHASAVPNDPSYPLQWNFDNLVYGGINAAQAWDTTTGTGVIVGILDTGVAFENRGRFRLAPDLAATSFVSGYDVVNDDTHPNDDNSHGTHVAGTVAQSTNNSLGVAGVSFSSSLMPVKILDDNGDGTYADLAAGLVWATDNGAKIVNMSLSGPSAGQVLEDAVAYAYANGVTVIAATGNDGVDGVGYPAAYDNYVIAVGATRYDETRADYSNYGTELDMMGPGGDLDVDQNADGYGDGIVQNTFDPNTKNPKNFGYWFFEGTSMATPHVAGVAALIYASDIKHPNAIRDILQSTAEDLGVPGRDDLYGHGLVDALAAVQEAEERVGKWTAHSQNPLHGQEVGGPKVYYPTVVHDPNRFSGNGGEAYYKMWFGTADGETALATSNNGIDWTDQGVVMANGYHATVAYFPDTFTGVNSGVSPSSATMAYRMWYWDPPKIYTVEAIRYAESPNGVDWFNDQPLQNGAVPIVTGVVPDLNRGTYGLGANVIYNSNASNSGTDWAFTAYYDGTPGGTEAIFLGFSADGITWTAYDGDGNGKADPVLSGTSNAGDWDFSHVSRPAVVESPDGTYRMYYSGGNGSIKDGIGCAFSTDGGLSWTREAGNPILHVSDGVSWRAARSYTAAVHKDASSLMIWFAGQALSGNTSMGYMSMPPDGAVLAASNTPEGTNVSVRPADVATGTAPVELTFLQVDRAGTTSLALRTPDIPEPAGYGWGDPALYHDLTTTAAFSGPVKICIDRSDVGFSETENLKLLHLEDGTWGDVTTAVDGQVICGQTLSLSHFGVFDQKQALAALTGAELAVIGGSAKIHGDVLSGGDVRIKTGNRKRPGTIDGSVRAAGDAHFGSYNRVAGDVTLGGKFRQRGRKRASTVQIEGELVEHAQMDVVALPPLTTRPDQKGPRVNVPPRSAADLPPDAYGPLRAGRGATVTLHSGTYYFEAFVLKDGAKLDLRLDHGPITLNIETALQFGRHTQTTIEGGDAGDVLFNVSGGDTPNRKHKSDDDSGDSSPSLSAHIMRGARVAGTIFAPQGKVHQGPRSTVEGALIAREVHLSQQATFSAHLARHFNSSPGPAASKRQAATGEQPRSFTLSQNYPNPFNPETAIHFDLPVTTAVELTLHNIAGQKVATLAHGHREAGEYTLRWDGRDDDGKELASGVYLYRLQAGSRVETRKLLLLR